MTTSFAVNICVVFLALIVFPSVLAAKSSTPRFQENKPCKRMVLYYHNILFNGTDQANATSVTVANATKLGSTNMGMLVTFNDPITADGNLLSPPIAISQGFYIYDRKDAYNAWITITLLFNSTEHKGTLTIMGADVIMAKTKDLVVVGGTGDFFMTRGIATIAEAIQVGLYYFRLKLDIKLYECY